MLGPEPDQVSAESEPGFFEPVDQWAFSDDLGNAIRALRHARKLTLENVAARSGISIGALSQVERGKGNPAFFTLIKIAHALDVPLTSLLEAGSAVSPVVRAGERRPLTPHFFSQEGVESELMTPDLDRQLQVTQYWLPPGASTEATPFVHRGEEFITVLAGRVSVSVNSSLYELDPGDSISFLASAEHWFGNLGSEPARILFVCTPPTF